MGVLRSVLAGSALAVLAFGTTTAQQAPNPAANIDEAAIRADAAGSYEIAR